MSTKIVCVVNNFDVFDKVVKNNCSLKDCEIISYDNIVENVSIPIRYNDFIINNVLNCDEEFWCVFIHQDFGFTENLENKLPRMDKSCIYGAVGIKLFSIKALQKLGLYEKMKIKGKNKLKVPFGKIKQGNNDFTFRDYGLEVFTQIVVDAIDCCCIMMHSSLIKKYNLLFDENLSFHLYAEELCYRAKKDFKIDTRVIQTKCFHMGIGSLSDEFYKSLKYVNEKFNIAAIPSTCPTENVVF